MRTASRSLTPLIFVLGAYNSVFAEGRPTKPMRLWSDAAPGAMGKEDKDIPTLTPFWPDLTEASGAAMVVCPGGGYNVLAPHEGEAYARWLNDLCIAAFVLKYRLVKDGYHVPVILEDAARAVRTVRSHAKDWNLDPHRIGIIGSSAGGHLSATLITRFDSGHADAADPIERVSSRPDLAVLCYAFILFDRSDKSDRHNRFLGPNHTAEQIREFSPALNVTKDTPPCFIWQTVEDSAVVVENALVFSDSLRRAGIPFDLHLYQTGRHGIGLGTKDFDPDKLHPWTRACTFWLREQNFLVPSQVRARGADAYVAPKGYVCYRADMAAAASSSPSPLGGEGRVEGSSDGITTLGTETDAAPLTLTFSAKGRGDQIPTRRITIDGRLDEPAWQAAPWTDNFVDIEGDLKPLPRFCTRAKMLWDDDYFYMAAELDEPHVCGTLTVRDSVIFHDNDFEVFIDPDGDNHNYGEFEINALNTGWDLRLPKPYKDGGKADDGWEITGIRTAVRVNGTLNDPRDTDLGWTIEIAIPWSIAASLADLSAPIRTARRNGSVFEKYENAISSVGNGLRAVPQARPRNGTEGVPYRSPRDGDQWRVNFSRVEWRHRITPEEKYEKIPNTREDNWVWSPQWTINMHRPETWGYVKFSSADVGSDAARAVKFTPDPAGPAKHLLTRLYYSQIEYRKKNDRFSQTIDALGLGDFTHASLAGPIALEVAGDSFVAVAVVKLADGSTARWHIREDSRIWPETR